MLRAIIKTKFRKLPLLQCYKKNLSNRIAFNFINKDQTGKFYMINFCDTFMCTNLAGLLNPLTACNSRSIPLMYVYLESCESIPK